MRIAHRFFIVSGVPEGRGLAIENVLGVAGFAADPKNAPACFGNDFTVCVDRVDFSDGGGVLSVDGIERFEAEKASFLWVRNFRRVSKAPVGSEPKLTT